MRSRLTPQQRGTPGQVGEEPARAEFDYPSIIARRHLQVRSTANIQMLTRIQVLDDLMEQVEHQDPVVKARAFELGVDTLHRDRLKNLGGNDRVADIISSMDGGMVIPYVSKIEDIVCD